MDYTENDGIAPTNMPSNYDFIQKTKHSVLFCKRNKVSKDGHDILRKVEVDVCCQCV